MGSTGSVGRGRKAAADETKGLNLGEERGEKGGGVFRQLISFSGRSPEFLDRFQIS